jgi:hypothetical protein
VGLDSSLVVRGAGDRGELLLKKPNFNRNAEKYVERKWPKRCKGAHEDDFMRFALRKCSSPYSIEASCVAPRLRRVCCAVVLLRLFSTVIHSFAQGSCENSIDASKQKPYVPRQIEPEA